MRPAKHVTHSRTRPQEIFDISLARLQSEKKGIPVAATSESETITIFLWDESDGRWRSVGIGHVPITTPRDVPSITNTWNWSRRVGLVTFDDTIGVVYKRAETVPPEEAPKPAALMLDTYKLDGDVLRRELRIPVPMPTFTRTIFFNDQPIIQRVAEKPGFELWAGVDLNKRQLLILTQTLGETATDKGDGAQLTLIIGELDQLDNESAWTFKHLDAGGYGLDVRQQGDKLILAYRQTPHSLKVPLPLTQIDPGFSGVPQVELDALPASDQFYTRLRIMFVELDTLATRTLDLPGGEHPRIQSVDPLFVIVDRPRMTVRFRVVRNAEGVAEPRVDWILRGVRKQAFLLDDQERVARGVLMSFLQGDSNTFSRTGTPWIDAQDLFTTPAPQGIGWASTKARFPLEPLRVDRDEKGLFFDFLHKAPLFALLESRARLIADFDQGTLSVADVQSVVYDINHAQIEPTDALRPDTAGENTHFAPFDRLAQQSGNVFRAPSYIPDNTIGGSLVTDRDGIPYQFFSYTDLGDGGLRVIYDADLGPPGAPPPVEKPKTLEPEQVPGPGSVDERWIELKTDGWTDAGVPAMQIENVLHQRTVTSAVYAQIESLLFAGPGFAGLGVDEENGWSEQQVNDIQTAINDFLESVGTDPEIQFSNDGVVPRAFISMLPPAVVAEARTTWEAGIENEEITAVSWRFSLTTPVGLIVINVDGNPADVTLPLDGDWTVRAEITRNDDTIRTFTTVVAVAESLFRRSSRVHRDMAERDLGEPLSTLGTLRIGTTTFKLLQYELVFPVDQDETRTKDIIIKILDKTDAQWRFRDNGTEQGVIDYRFRVKFETSDVRLGGLLNSLLKIESIKGSFFYGRSFTPGLLMNDTRSAVPLTGAESSTDGLRHGVDGDDDARLAVALTARPFGDDSTTTESVKVKVSMLGQAVAASVITLLVGLGAAAAATTLIALVAALGIATAAAAAPLAGLAAAAAVVAATVAIFIFINFVVPPIVERAIEDSIERGLTSADSRDSLADARFLQFAGEGIAETIARRIIEEAQLDPAPPTTPKEMGRDRDRQGIFQMIHVSNGRLRVLIRA